MLRRNVSGWVRSEIADASGGDVLIDFAHLTRIAAWESGSFHMKRAVLAACLLFALPSFGQVCPVPDMKSVQKSDPVPLCLVAEKVKQALDDYNADPTTAGRHCRRFRVPTSTSKWRGRRRVDSR
jgi:hypothetical protein